MLGESDSVDVAAEAGERSPYVNVSFWRVGFAREMAKHLGLRSNVASSSVQKLSCESEDV